MNLPPADFAPARVPVAELLSFTQEWAVLKRCFDGMARLPAEAGAFQARYGAFADPAAVEAFVAAVASVQRIARQLGGPSALAQRLAARPDSLSADEPPDDVYAQLAWLARRVGTAARTLGGAAPWREGSASSSATEQATRLRWALAGAGGLARTAAATATQVETVRAGLAPLSNDFVTAMQAFHASQLVNQANFAIGSQRSALARLEDEAGSAGDKAGHWWQRDKAETAAQALALRATAEREQLARKQALVDDTAGLFSTGNGVVPALAQVDEKLRRLARLFAEAAGRLGTVAQISNSEQLGDADWLEHTLELPASAQRWAELEAAAQRALREAGVGVGRA